MARMLCWSRTSSDRGTARRPSASISVTNGSRSSLRRLVTMRSAPAAASARAKYWPTPRVDPVEPGRAIAERRNRGDERLDLDFSIGDQLNCPGVFSGGGTRSLQPDLTRDDFLQWQRDLRGKVADQGYGAAFADAIDRAGDGLVTADGFQDARSGERRGG